MNLTQEFFHSLITLLDNAVLFWGLLACGLAQLSKLFVELIFYRRWRPAVLLETGGMPSSHSALVTATAAGIGSELGFDHPGFALAVTFAFVVMYDASGIRRSAGVIAGRVNELTVATLTSPLEDKLKENLGHSRLEVFVGSLVGPAIALPGIIVLGSPLHLMNSLGLSIG